MYATDRYPSLGNFRWYIRSIWLAVVVILLLGKQANAASLDEISFVSLAGDRVQVKLDLSEPLGQEPLHFVIDNPARIALDLLNVSSNLASRSQTIGIGVAHSVTAVEAAGRTRVVFNLARSVPYDVHVQGNSILLTLEATQPSADGPTAHAAASKESIQHIDFRRGGQGEGRIIIELSDPSMVVNLSRKGDDIIADFIGAQLPEELDRRLDVTDFSTPVKEIDTSPNGPHTRMVILTTSSSYDYLAYQTQNNYTIEFKPLTKAEIEQVKKDKFGYTGDRLSFNFQNIEVRAVLQLIADFVGVNLVVDDAVGGNLTLRLKNVPWDQALDIILKARGLGQRQTGNVLLIAPQEEIAARERLELESERQIDELAPLRTEFVQVNYAKADEMATLIQADEVSLLSERGSVAIDARTNTLIIQDIADRLEAIRNLVVQLDVPIRQVLIESRIVNAEENFARSLGVRFGYSRQAVFGDGSVGVNISGREQGGVISSDADGDTFTIGPAVNDAEPLLINLPIAADAISEDPVGSSLGFLIAGNSYLLQLELSALIAEGRAEAIASPRVITANQSEASIEAGVEIPYQEASSSGATSVSFKKAVLSLSVTPQITPDDRIFMDLDISQDTRGEAVLGVPAINTRNIATKVLVENGDTVVLGGIYTQVDIDEVQRVPFFSELPYIGTLFRNSFQDDDKSELLIFITPKILKDSLSSI